MFSVVTSDGNRHVHIVSIGSCGIGIIVEPSVERFNYFSRCVVERGNSKYFTSRIFMRLSMEWAHLSSVCSCHFCDTIWNLSEIQPCTMPIFSNWIHSHQIVQWLQIRRRKKKIENPTNPNSNAIDDTDNWRMKWNSNFKFFKSIQFSMESGSGFNREKISWRTSNKYFTNQSSQIWNLWKKTTSKLLRTFAACISRACARFWFWTRISRVNHIFGRYQNRNRLSSIDFVSSFALLCNCSTQIRSILYGFDVWIWEKYSKRKREKLKTLSSFHCLLCCCLKRHGWRLWWLWIHTEWNDWISICVQFEITWKQQRDVNV